jgi:hypothetical protein
MGDVRSLGSVLPGLQGKSLAGAASIIGDVQDKNVNTFNQWAARDAERQQEYNKYAADLASQRGFVARDSDVFNRNQWRSYFRNLGAAKANMWNNATKWNLMNQTNQRYNIDPWTGELVFKPGMGSMASSTGSGYPSGANYETMKRQFPGLTYDQYFSPAFRSAYKGDESNDQTSNFMSMLTGAFGGSMF